MMQMLKYGKRTKFNLNSNCGTTDKPIYVNEMLPHWYCKRSSVLSSAEPPLEVTVSARLFL